MNYSALNVAIAKSGKTIKDMCCEIGVHPTTFYKKRLYESSMNTNTAKKIAIALKLSPDEANDIFFDGELPECKYKPACERLIDEYVNKVKGGSNDE